MTDLDLLRQAIIANPDEDVPRLMYADEVAGTDPAYSEFIRLQIELDGPNALNLGSCSQCFLARRGQQTTNGPCRCSPEWMQKRRREHEFLFNPNRPNCFGFGTLVATATNWPKYQAVMLGTDQFAVRVSRGFIDRIVAPTTVGFLKWAPVLFRAQPITQVLIMDKTPANLRRKAGGMSRCWTWFRNPTSHVSAARIPEVIWPDPKRRRMNYDTDGEALGGLSKWCVSYGRRVAKEAEAKS